MIQDSVDILIFDFFRICLGMEADGISKARCVSCRISICIDRDDTIETLQLKHKR